MTVEQSNEYIGDLRRCRHRRYCRSSGGSNLFRDVEESGRSVVLLVGLLLGEPVHDVHDVHDGDALDGVSRKV